MPTMGTVSNAATSVERGLQVARSAKAKLAAVQENIAADAAVGLTREGGNFAIKVNLQRPMAGVPAEVDGVRVKTEIVGSIRKY